MTDLTWTCHVCGDERPDAMIAVYKRKLRHRETGVELYENIRYCQDRHLCTVGALTKTFFSSERYEEIA